MAARRCNAENVLHISDRQHVVHAELLEDVNEEADASIIQLHNLIRQVSDIQHILWNLKLQVLVIVEVAKNCPSTVRA